MYDEYPTIYETNTNQNLIIMSIIGILLLLLFILTLISLAKIYKKANRSMISAFIPIYNIIVLLEIVNLPTIYILLLLIPGINIIALIRIMLLLSTSFRKSKIFGLGLAFLPFIFIPLLAFGNSEYFGINLIAKTQTTTVTNIPQIDEKEEKDIVVNEEFDKANRNIDISIGGGVYQKKYTNTLLKADDNQKIEKKPNLINTNNKTSLNIEKDNSFIKEDIIQNQEETKKIKNSINVFEMPTMIDTNNTSNAQGIIDNNLVNNNNVVNNNTVVKEDNNNSEFISCPKCNTKLKKDSKVCFICGYHFD